MGVPKTLAMPGSREGRQSSRMSSPKARSPKAVAICPRVMRSPGQWAATSATRRDIGAPAWGSGAPGLNG